MMVIRNNNPLLPLGKGDTMMAKLIIITPDMLEEAKEEFGDPFAENPLLQQILEEMEQWMEEEKARRDAAYAAEQMDSQTQESL